MKQLKLNILIKLLLKFDWFYNIDAKNRNNLSIDTKTVKILDEKKNIAKWKKRVLKLYG